MLGFTFSNPRYFYVNDDTRLYIAFLQLARLMSVLRRLSHLRRHALLGRSMLYKNALYTDEEEERFSRNILEQINYFVYVDGT